jgi:hypothetical protein
MEIVYSFQGRLPEYIIYTIHQARCFHTGPITLFIDDFNSPYLEQIKNYNVTIISAFDYVDLPFIQAVEQNLSKFCIAEKLGDRKLLFIRSFERFFLLKNWMKLNKKENILFLELDMLIYFKPDELLPILSKRDMTFTHTQNDVKCAAFFYIKNPSALERLTSYFLFYIINPENKKDISEMHAIWNWLTVPGVRDSIFMLPGLWKEEKYHKDIWENFETFKYTLFDSMGIGVNLDGPDFTHREEWERRNKRWWAVDVDYRDYGFEWKIINGNRILYLFDENQNQYKVQCIHVHNKNLLAFLSKSM